MSAIYGYVAGDLISFFRCMEYRVDKESFFYFVVNSEDI